MSHIFLAKFMLKGRQLAHWPMVKTSPDSGWIHSLLCALLKRWHLELHDVRRAICCRRVGTSPQRTEGKAHFGLQWRLCVPGWSVQLGVPHPITCWSFQRQLVKKHVANSKHKISVICVKLFKYQIGRARSKHDPKRVWSARVLSFDLIRTHSHFSQLILPLVVSLTSVSNIHEC